MVHSLSSDSWLSKNVRPIVLIIAFITLSLIMLFQIPVVEWLLKAYVGWTGTMVTFYFVGREIVKFVSRKKNS
jgi:phosphotransferase system  glucose/maltose/N-acetylglucosamine-specific IIC component